jgi:hypothetical protein
MIPQRIDTPRHLPDLRTFPDIHPPRPPTDAAHIPEGAGRTMRKIRRRWIVAGGAVAAVLIVPALAWVSLTHQPSFYRAVATMPKERRRAEARRFVAQSMQLRNDIVNEPRWEAAFTDEEVNAWLAEDLVTHFADQIPPGVHEPRVVFEPDRVTLAFQLDEGPIRTVIWVVAQVRVPEGNTVALTLEKIRAGVVPIAAERIIDRITEHARSRGLDVRWERDGDLPVAIVHYTPDPRRDDIVLEALEIRPGQIRLGGRSNKSRGAIASPTLPSRRFLQSTFPQPKAQPKPSSPLSSRSSTTSPLT